MKTDALQTKHENIISDDSKKNSAYFKRLAIGVLCLNLLVLLLIVVLLAENRKTHEESALNAVTNLAKLLENEIVDIYEKIDLALQSVTDEFKELSESDRSGTKDWNLRLTRIRDSLPVLNGVRATNATGDVIYGLSSTDSTNTNISDRDYFIRLRDDRNVGLFITSPIQGRVTGKWAILLARRLNFKDGKFGGVVVASIPLDYFSGIFSSLKLYSKGSIGFRDNNLRLIVRYPSATKGDGAIGASKISDDFKNALKINPNIGSYNVSRTSIDSVSRLHHYRRNAAYGFYINVGFAHDDIYSAWHKLIWQTTGLVGLFIFGSLTFVWLMRRGITERKLAESALQKKSLEMQQLSETAATGLIRCSRNLCYLTANTAYAKLAGVSREQIIDKPIVEVMGEQGLLSIMPFVERVLSGERVEFETEVPFKTSSSRYLHVIYTPDVDGNGDIIGWFASITDITERKLSEDDLRKSKEFLEITQRSAGAGSWTWDLTTNQLHWSPEQYKMFGFESDNTTTTFDLWRSVLHPDDLELAEVNIKKSISDHTDLFNEYRIKKPSGEIRWINAHGQTSYDDLGKPQRMSGICLDVTDRKKIENIQSDLLRFGSLHPNVDFFKSLASYLAYTLNMDYVCIDRLHGNNLIATTLAVYHNGEFEDNVTYTLKDTPCGDVLGKEVCVFPSAVRNLFPKDESLEVLQAESYVGTTLWSFDMKPIGLIAVIGRNPLKDSRFSETVLKLVSNRAAGELERRQVEEEKDKIEQQFQQAQKLESLGVLAGGIAHDFNNILAIIMGNCSLAKMDTENADSYLPEIEKATERAAALCRQMLAYAGKAQLAMSQVNMSLLVDEMVKMLRATLPQNTIILSEPSVDTPAIIGDESQLRQIVMNLIINASEAIGKDQGEIKVSLTKTTITTDHDNLDYHGKLIHPGDYVCLTVTDNGCGMDEETKLRIFEPFYTTKFTGRGLGMSAVLGIINSHKGALQLNSKPGHGTAFKVYLPIPKDASTKDSNIEQTVQTPPWQGSGTILLVEDEEQIRKLARLMLQKLGFTVIEASNGKEALELYQENTPNITLVMSDMGMPVMDGYDLFHELKKLNPQLPIVISSGFGDADVTSRIYSGDIAGLINKPYTPDQLRDVLKSIIEKRPG